MPDEDKRVVHDVKMEDEIEDRFADAILRGIDGVDVYAESDSSADDSNSPTDTAGDGSTRQAEVSDEPIKIVELLCEGGGEDVWGQCIAAQWSYWRTGNSWGLDENDDEVTTTWKTDPVDSLEQVMPEGWFWLHPRNVHPEFVEPLSAWYRHAVMKLDDQQKGVLKDRWRRGLLIK